MLEGQEGKLFIPLAFTKTFALIGSAILSITLIPVLMTYFVNQSTFKWKKKTFIQS